MRLVKSVWTHSGYRRRPPSFWLQGVTIKAIKFPRKKTLSVTKNMSTCDLHSNWLKLITNCVQQEWDQAIYQHSECNKSHQSWRQVAKLSGQAAPIAKMAMRVNLNCAWMKESVQQMAWSNRKTPILKEGDFPTLPIGSHIIHRKVVLWPLVSTHEKTAVGKPEPNDNSK